MMLLAIFAAVALSLDRHRHLRRDVVRRERADPGNRRPDGGRRRPSRRDVAGAAAGHGADRHWAGASAWPAWWPRAARFGARCSKCSRLIRSRLARRGRDARRRRAGRRLVSGVAGQPRRSHRCTPLRVAVRGRPLVRWRPLLHAGQRPDVHLQVVGAAVGAAAEGDGLGAAAGQVGQEPVRTERAQRKVAAEPLSTRPSPLPHDLDGEAAWVPIGADVPWRSGPSRGCDRQGRCRRMLRRRRRGAASGRSGQRRVVAVAEHDDGDAAARSIAICAV